jgi:hypothetical protein
VGFHLIGRDVKRGRIIAVTADHDDDLSLALAAFAAGTIATNEGADTIDRRETLPCGHRAVRLAHYTGTLPDLWLRGSDAPRPQSLIGNIAVDQALRLSRTSLTPCPRN